MKTRDHQSDVRVAPTDSAPCPFPCDEARRKLSAAGQAIQRVIKAQPLMALGVSLGLGVALGWLIKRR